MFRVLQHVEKILLALSVVALIFFGLRSSDRLRELEGIAERNPIIGGTPAPYVYQRTQMPDIGLVTWPVAPAQSTGPEWVYDVFTPPVIYYNPRTSEFTVTPPVVNAPVAARDDTPFEVELVDVRQKRYRIQLVGNVGDPRGGADLALLQFLEEGGETKLGRAGETFPQQEFTLLSFQVQNLTTTSSNSMPVVEPVAVAVIIDRQTGREETLTNREPKMLPKLQAVVRLRTLPPKELEVGEGEAFEVNGYSYLVTQLTLAPKQAVISRRAVGSFGSSETRTLIPLPGASTLGSGPSSARRPASAPPSF